MDRKGPGTGRSVRVRPRPTFADPIFGSWSDLLCPGGPQRFPLAANGPRLRCVNGWHPPPPWTRLGALYTILKGFMTFSLFHEREIVHFLIITGPRLCRVPLRLVASLSLDTVLPLLVRTQRPRGPLSHHVPRVVPTLSEASRVNSGVPFLLACRKGAVHHTGHPDPPHITRTSARWSLHRLGEKSRVSKGETLCKVVLVSHAC